MNIKTTEYNMSVVFSTLKFSRVIPEFNDTISATVVLNLIAIIHNVSLYFMVANSLNMYSLNNNSEQVV